MKLTDKQRAEVADMLASPGWQVYKKWAKTKATQISEEVMKPKSKDPGEWTKGKYWGFLEAVEGIEREFAVVQYAASQQEDDSASDLRWSGFDSRESGPKAGVRP